MVEQRGISSVIEPPRGTSGESRSGEPGRSVSTDEDTTAPVDVGRTRYRPPTAMATRVAIRDQHSRWPGCRVSAKYCDLDHVDEHRPDGTGGATGDANLGHLCRRHHRIKSETLWSDTVDPGGVIAWRNQTTGVEITTYPETIPDN